MKFSTQPTTTDLNNAQILWDYHCINQQLQPSNNTRIILGLGSYDLRVADYCAELYLAGLGQHIMFSGKDGNWTKERWDKSEAEIFKERAEQQGVLRSVIYLEENATNLGENVRYSRKLVEHLSLTCDKIILVTKPNTTRRAYTAYMVYWPEMPVLMAAPTIQLTDRAPQQHLREIIDELVGDTERIISYPAHGYQIYQEVPQQVLQAYQQLRISGYTKHCQETTHIPAIDSSIRVNSAR